MASIVLGFLFCFAIAAGNTDDNPIVQLMSKASEPCFEVIDHPQCNTTVFAKFTAKNAIHGGGDPDTSMYLFTRANPDKAELLHRCGAELPSATTYNKTCCRTVILFHGWMDGVCRTAWMREMKELLLQREEICHVICVSWTWGNTPEYPKAGQNCRVVGEQIGFMINNIIRQTGCGPDYFHVVGHSFGAVGAGEIGRMVKGIRRITGLDPAYAPYKNAPPNQILTYRDAKIVDIIHSNAADCFYAGIGDPRALGHADFYPNGGSVQPSCYSDIATSILKNDFCYGMSSFEPRLCSHLASIRLFKLSINPKGCEFVGVISKSFEEFKSRNASCNLCRKDWAVMGMNYEDYPSGQPQNSNKRKYFLHTALTCPYYNSSYLGRNRFPFDTSCSS